MIREIQSFHPPELDVNVRGPRGVTREQAVKNREIVQAIRTVEQFGGVSPHSELRLAIDSGTGEPLIRVVSRVTNEVIGQIPPEGILRAAELLRELQQPDKF